MTRIVLIAVLSLTATAAFAQQQNSACSRDVTRHCRAVMDGGDMAVLACLKQHRSALSRGCAKVLTDNGQ